MSIRRDELLTALGALTGTPRAILYLEELRSLAIEAGFKF